MTDARSEMLERIRRALGEPVRGRVDDYRAIPRAYQQTGTLARDERVQTFVSRLEHYDAVVYRCREDSVSRTIAEALSARAKHQVVVPPGLPREWLPEGPEFVADKNLSCGELDRVDGVLTGCTVGIALTGTIVLRHAAAEGRRALTLIPDYHLCVIRADQVVETVAEGLRHVGGFNPALLTTISGPSATADIEMTRIKGVHGPRTLDVILVDAN
jgi:L-lactate dehydrogenase complex protein LldG